MKPKFGNPQLPIRITRPITASHIPYSINQITKSLASQIETETTADDAGGKKQDLFPRTLEEIKIPLKKFNE